MSWKVKSLDDLCDEITVGFVGSMASEYVEYGIPFLRSLNIEPFKLNLNKSQLKFINEDFHLKIKKSKLYGGDLAIVRTGTPGTCCVIPYDFGEVNCSDLVIARPKKEVNSQFLCYFINSPLGMGSVGGSLVGVAQKHFNVSVAKRMQIPIPDYPTQNRIASILSAYDDLIENNLKRIKLLEETAQNIYKEWFVNFRFPNYENTEFNTEGGLPVGWEMKKLSELVNLTMGQSPKSEFYNENREGLPFHQGVTGYGQRFVTHSTYCTNITRIAEEGDILFSVRAPVGRLNIAPERLIIGRGLSSIRNKRNCQSFQLYQLKKHFFQEDLIGGGAIFNSVTKNDLENQLMISPTNEVLDEFERIVKPIDDQIWKLNIQNQKLKEARDILLPRLMNRTIEV